MMLSSMHNDLMCEFEAYDHYLDLVVSIENEVWENFCHEVARINNAIWLI